MNNLLRNFNVGLIGDSHLTRMAPFMQPQVRIIGRGGERASNYARYLQEVRQLDIFVIFIGGNDITGKNGSPASSKLKDLVHDIKSLFSYARSYGVMVLTCDIIPRDANKNGTGLTNKRLLKRFKRKHIVLRGCFNFRMLRDTVHLENYDELWELLEAKMVQRLHDAYRF